MPYELKNVLNACGTISANTNIVAAITANGGRRIKVTAYLITTTYSAGSLGIVFSDGNAGTTVWALTLQAAAGSISGANLAKSSPDAIFATSLSNGLWLNPSGQSVTYSISYFADDSY